MKRSYIYTMVILLTITLVSADFIIGKDLNKIIPLDSNDNSITDVDDYLIKEISALTTITVKNEQNSDEELTYKYLFKADNLVGAVKYKYNDKEKYLIFTANGEGTFELKSNESIIFYDIPVDLEYTITQQTTDSKYKVMVNKEETTTYKGKTSTDDTIVFNNSPKKESNKKEEAKQEESKKEDSIPKQDEKEEKQEDNVIEKKDVPNTGESEVKMILVLLISIISIFCIKKIKIKRFE